MPQKNPLDSSDTPSDQVQQKLRSDVHLAKFRATQFLYTVAGHIALGFGLLGVLLPLLPTTPLLLLAGFCYARGSERFYLWLMTNRYFGPYMRAWRDNRGIPLTVKVYVIVLLWFVMGATIVFVVPLWPVRVLLAVIAMGVTVLILQLPTQRD